MKRIICTLLAGVMLLALLTACSEKEEYDFTYMRPTWWGSTYYKHGAYEKEVFEQSGIKVNVQIVPVSDFHAKAKTIIASGNMPDLVWGEDPAVPFYYDAIQQGAFMNIRPYIDQYPAIRAALPEDVWERVTTEAGEIYFLPYYTDPCTPMLVLYRKDWFDKLGIEEPTNIDEFTKTLEILKNSEIEGANNIIPFTTPMLWTSKELVTTFDVAMDSWQVSDDDPSTIVPWFMKQGAEDLQFWLQDLYTRGLIDQDYLINNNIEQMGNKFSNGQAAMISTHWSGFSTYLTTMREIDPDVEIGIMSPLTGVNGNAMGVRMVSPIDVGIYVNTKTKNADAIFRYINWQVTEGHDLMNAGIEGKTYTVEPDGRKKTIPNDKREADYQDTQREPLMTIGIYHKDAIIDWEELESAFELQGIGEYFDYCKTKYQEYAETPYVDLRNPIRISQLETENYKKLYEEYIKNSFEPIPVKPDITREAWRTQIERWLSAGGKEIIEDVNKAQGNR